MNGKNWLSATAVVLLFLTGCSTSDADAGAEPSPPTHTMPDGMVMDGSEMPDTGEQGAADPSTPVGPSPAARMVCSGDVVDDVTRILGLDTAPSPTSSWAEPVYTCTYNLDSGPLVLSVHDATDAEVGRAHFETLRTRLGDTEELRGMYGLGLPAYETDDGTVAFIKDGKTLRVDATALPGRLGPDRAMSQTDLAYAVATSVLACWTAHA